jgi:hypothetical protein
LVAFALGEVGCFPLTGPASALNPIPRDSTPVVRACDVASCRGQASFTYLGVSGFVLRSGTDAIMTGPSFTHPGMFTVATPKLHIHSDTAEVDHQLRRLLRDSLKDLQSVESILIGHSHYDHLLDVPYLARHYARQATIVGGLTTKRTLMGDAWLRAHPASVDSISGDEIGTPSRVGRWVYSKSRRLRFMALQSSHAPNWWIITIAKCHENHDRTSLPKTAWGWCMGDPFSYLIDLLDVQGQPVLRVYYQDAAARPADVFLPPFVGTDRHDVDVAIVCAGNFNKVDDYPTKLLTALHPPLVIVGHWEDFFHSIADEPTPVRFTDTRLLASRLGQASSTRWMTPTPGGRIRVEF